MHRARIALSTTLLVATLALTGCHYAIRDAGGERTYYTTSYNKTRSGDITFKDAKTEAEVKLQSYEIRKISGEEYKKAIEPAEDPGS